MIKSYITKLLIMVVIFTTLICTMDYFRIDIDLENMFRVKVVYSLVGSINKSKASINTMKKQIEECENELAKCNTQKVDYINNKFQLTDQINKLKIISGEQDVKGPGITLRVADNLNENYNGYGDKIVHDLDVRLIINDLINLGAEAIAINGKRIVSSSEIICSGPVIKVNGEVVAAPFFIKAIGNPEQLINAVSSEDSYAYKVITEDGKDITAMKSYIITISGKKDNTHIKYAKCVK